jgi:hypothetical protein
MLQMPRILLTIRTGAIAHEEPPMTAQKSEQKPTSSQSRSTPSPSTTPPIRGGGTNAQLKASLLGHDYSTQVQMLTPDGGTPGGAPSVHQAAAHGISGGGGKLPDADSIQKSFGGYDISNVQAHMSGPAAEASRAMGADAYATGNHVVLGEGGKDLHTQAHEAAHVVQQQHGVSLSGGVGKAGDAYERNADAVADAVVQGKSAEGILGEMTGGGGGGGGVQMQEAPLADNAPKTPDEDSGKTEVVDAAPPQVSAGGTKGGPMAKAAAVKILEDAFGTYKTMSGGALEVLDAAAFKEAWERVYGKTKYSWDKWVVLKPGGSLNGFAHKGINYVNKESANLGTVPHEMLHNNTAADWTAVVGSEFNEGATDYLKQYALKKAGKTSPNSYPSQMAVVATYVAIASEDSLFTAYLKGGADKLVKEKVDTDCGSWADVKDAMQAKDFAKAKIKLKKKA